MYYVVHIAMAFLVKITRKYQITIPKEIREKLNLRVGDLLKVELEDDKIVLRPLIKREKDPLEEMLNLVKEPLDIDAVKLVEESWNED
ncbi:MAG: AbrB family transcriptional regulator [Thermoprotei archaeon]|nr:MAG: AbrB family transcriptional regulator [Thermoprotei archaeon]